MAKTRLEEIRKIRLDRVEKLRGLGVDPYPARLEKDPENILKARDSKGLNVIAVGRLMGLRGHGNVIFADLRDESGQIQVFFQKNNLGDDFKVVKLLDIGDFVLVEGKVIETEAGELTIDVEFIQFLTKSIRPLPSSWYGLENVEIRHRKRHLDLLMNPKVKSAFDLRSEILFSLRQFLHSEEFVEAEIPVLQSVAGGATAKPFVTHLEALDQDYFLRIAPELYLKRLLVGGYEKVYDLGKNFRNEGFSLKHNPEYTLLEFYWAYADYNDIMELTERMFSYLAKKVLGKNSFEYKGNKISLKSPWQRIKMRDIIFDKTEIDIDKISADELKDYLKKKKIETTRLDDRGKLIDKLFSAEVEPGLIQPTFIIDLPIDISPLAKKISDKPDYVQRFELFMGGLEIANAYSELNDPVDQEERFLEQAKRKEAGDEEAHPIDEDYVEALEYGMPPAAGVGYGVDRMVLLFADLPNIRETILFPTLRPASQKQKSG